MPRPKGTPKTGGRQKGTPNRVNAASRDRIEQEADPIGFLIRIVRGEALEDEKPSLDQRMNAARLLAGKVLPDLRGIEMQLDDQREKSVSEMTDAEIEAMLATAQPQEAVA